MFAETRCPTCGKAVPIPPENEPLRWFPFCSQRCKLIDLGRWLDGKYQIPVTEPEPEQWDEDSSDRQS